MYTCKITDFNFQIGPGIVYLEFESFFGKGVFIQSLTPAEPMVQKLVHNLYMHWAVPNIITKFFMYGEAVQVNMLNFVAILLIRYIYQLYCSNADL